MVFGVSDISSSEGNLRRFIRVCEILGLQAQHADRVFEWASKNAGISSRKVFDRHIRLLQSLGLVATGNGRIILTGYGKALVSVSQRTKDARLNLLERILFFKSIFTSPLAEQMVSLIQTIIETRSSSRKEILRAFFSGGVASQVWNRHVIQSNLARLEHGKRSSFLVNKFGCMISWLRQLDLIRIDDSEVLLAKGGLQAFPILRAPETRNRRVLLAATLAYGLDASNFNWNIHGQSFTEMVKKSARLFGGHTDLIDAKALSSYVCANFISRSVLLEEHEFYGFLRHLVDTGVITSIFIGRDGIPSHIAIV